MERDTKEEKKTFKVKYLYQLFGISKQGYYHRIKRDNKRKERDQYILNEVQEIRKVLPRCGAKKLYIKVMIQWFISHIQNSLKSGNLHFQG